MIGSNAIGKISDPISRGLSDTQINRLSSFVKEHTGIELGDGKRDLILTRIYKRLKTLGEDDIGAYLGTALDVSSEESRLLLDTLTTNKTAFFREQPHFDFLETVILPDLASRSSGDRKIRCWSAACSSGEEPYSLLMALHESQTMQRLRIEDILATDISEVVLKKAMSGVYSQQQLASLPAPLLSKYFTPEPSAQNSWRIQQEMRRKIAFRRFNLISSAYRFTYGFDIIFCRNVMIYFDNINRMKVIRGLVKSLRPRGYLFISHSESINLNEHPELCLLAPSVYQKSEAL
jgi:chemotaxis protein methyltransferase CheR